MHFRFHPTAVIPAKAGIYVSARAGGKMDPRFRGDDAQWGASAVGEAAVGNVTP